MDKDEKLIKLFDDIMAELDDVIETEKSNREEAVKDRRFIGVTGAMYEGFFTDVFDNRPKIEVDKVSLQITQIEGEYRRNKIEVRFDSEDKKNSATAISATDLFRSCRMEEGSDEAECNAFSEALRGGMGAFRFSVIEGDEESDDSDREIIMEPIFDADNSVYFDPNSKRQDKADADWCVVITGLTPRKFKSDYPNASEVSVQRSGSQSFDWFKPDRVFIGEYYAKEMVQTRLVTYLSLIGEEVKFTTEELTDELKQELIDTGYVTDDPRGISVKRKKVHKYIINGNEIIKDCGFIAGKSLPVVPMYGERFFIDGIERFNGKVRKTKDVVRLKNVNLSKLVETAAYSPIEKPIFNPEQVRGLETYWDNDHLMDYSYLLLNPITDAQGNSLPQGPIGYTHPPVIAPALAALLTMSDTDLNDIMGNQQAGIPIVNNQSGKAIELIQNKISMQSFIYLSNAGKCMKRAAEVYKSILEEVHNETGKRLSGTDKNRKRTSIELGKEVKVGDSFVKSNDFSVELVAIATVGPSSDSKKEGVIRMLLELLQTIGQADPDLASLLVSEILLNMDGTDGLDDITKFVRLSLIRKGVIEPTPEEAEQLKKEMEGQGPDAQTEFLQAQAEKTKAETASLKFKDDQVIAATEKTQADTEKVKADILKIVSDLHEKGQAAHAVQQAEQSKLLQQIMEALTAQQMMNPAGLVPPEQQLPQMNPALEFPPGVRGGQQFQEFQKTEPGMGEVQQVQE